MLATPLTKVQLSQLIMSVKQYTAKNYHLAVWINNIQQKDRKSSFFSNKQKTDLLAPLRKWLNNLEISDPIVAHRLCKSIPSQCPFERQIEIFGHTILRIPPLCKLNPLYEEVVALRFRAICYLADVCGEDVSSYC
jgi:hypothetical protein